MFPYFSEEARSQLNLPNSPVIHLAVTSLADKLMPFATGTKYEAKIVRISALRTASRATLEELPFPCALLHFRHGLDLPVDQAACDEAYRTTRTDWLGMAIAKLVAEGIDPGSSARRMASPYGWNPPQPEPLSEASKPNSSSNQTTLTEVDEHGRTWIVPGDVGGLKDLLNRYGRAHGRRPSEAAFAAFARHPGKMKAFWMLVLRGAEGERINLAARALALGSIPPMRPEPTPAPEGVERPADYWERRWAANDKRDQQLVEALRVEADEDRMFGYDD